MDVTTALFVTAGFLLVAFLAQWLPVEDDTDWDRRMA